MELRVRRAVPRERTSIGFGVAALAAYGGALASVIHGYQHALDNACPNNAPAPAVFWPLLVVAVVSAVVAFVLRPRRRDELGARVGTEFFAILVAIVVPFASLVTIFGYAFAYACWE